VARAHTAGNIAPAIVRLRAQVNATYPKRDKSSDGIWPSAAHTKANPSSDHENGNAIDFDDDLLPGDHAAYWDIWSVALGIVVSKDSRVKYLIHDNRIWSLAEGWRAYNGTNPHKTHLHISVKENRRTDSREWAIASPATNAHPAVSLAISKHSASKLEGFVLSGLLRPTIAKAPVIITYRRPGETTWRHWITVKTDAKSAYKVGTRGYRLGAYTYRVTFPGDAKHGVARYAYGTVTIVK
jgi:hypothetical protein